MEFFTVDVKSITPSLSSEQTDRSKVENLADSILECNGLLTPLILKQTGPEPYTVISEHTGDYAALKAREKYPRKGGMVNPCVIFPKDEEAVTRQWKGLDIPGTIENRGAEEVNS